MEISTGYSYVKEPARTTPVIGCCELLVAGGGLAGTSAAVTAARSGTRVILIEKSGFWGGVATGSIVGSICGLYSSGPSPEPLPGGFGWELVGKLQEAGRGFPFPFQRTTLFHYDPETMKSLLDRMVTECGLHLMLHTRIVDLVCDQGRITHVIVENKEGRRAISTDLVIDATGDADIVRCAGGETTVGDENGRLQPATCVFRMANVDLDAAMRVGREQLNSSMAEAAKSGRFRLPRTNGMFYPTSHPGEIVANMTRIVNINGVKADDLTRGELEGRAQIQEYAEFLKQTVPGFSRAFLSATGSHIGIRETRRIVGRYLLTEQDIMQGAKFADAIAAGAWPVEIHNPVGDGTRLGWLLDNSYYEIPYRCLLPRSLINVAAIGRCISTTHEAHGSTRVMGTCMAMGESAGLAATLAVNSKADFGGVDQAALKSGLSNLREKHRAALNSRAGL